MEKTILIILVGVIILATAGGAYMYLSQRQKPQEQTQPQTHPQQQQQQQTPTEGQGQQQQQETGSQQEQQQQETNSQQEQQQEQQQEVTFGQFLSNIVGKAFKATGTFSTKSESDEGATSMSGRFEMATMSEKFKFYMNVEESSQGIKGESIILSFQNDTNLITSIMCMKSVQTQNQWMCFKTTTSTSQVEQETGSAGMAKNPTTTWEEYKSKFTYEGLKEIHGIMLHCFYANYQENDTRVEERVCFDPQLNFFRYYWSERVSPEGATDIELFVDSISFTVSDSEFVPPAKPRSLPNIPGTP